jgi:hypothetical protein
MEDMPKKLTQEQIVKRFNEVHNNFYDYSKVNYVNDGTKVTIICPVHGEFQQRPADHARLRQGCPTCGFEKQLLSKKRHDIDKFLNILEKRTSSEFVNNLDFSNAVYKSMHTKLELFCKKSNIKFTQVPSSLILGICCSKCNKQKRLFKTSSSKLESFITRARKKHGDLYDYSQVEYTGYKSHVNIICKIHGVFKQRMTDHIGGNGCQACGFSQGESSIVVWLKERGIDHIHQHKVIIDQSVHWFDIYVPKFNLIIEFHGLQHFKPVSFFGGKKYFKILQKRDQIKKEYCEKMNIKLLVIHYKDKKNIAKILESNVSCTN